MKKILLVFASLIFAVLILPGILQPPGEAGARDATEVKQLARALDAALLDYRKEFGRFPEGSAGEIVSALCGRNEKEKAFLFLAPTAVNEHGEMLDPWGTPFRIAFDHVTGLPKIHSAGPNMIFEEKAGKHSDDYRSWHDSEIPASPLPF